MPEKRNPPEHFDAAEVAQVYRLGAIVGIAPIKDGEVWRVDTLTGSFCVHLHRPSIDRVHLEAMHQTMTVAAGAGLACPVPLKSPDGGSVFVRDGRLGDVTGWIEHDGVSIHRGPRSGELLVQAAAMAGRLHDVLAGLDLPVRSVESPWLSTTSLAERLPAAESALAAEAESAGRRGELAALVARARKAIELIGDRLDHDRLELQLTHGDFGGTNILCRGGEVIGVLDFGRLDYRPRLYDLTWLLYFLFHREKLTEKHWDLARRCCRAYGAATRRPVTQTEWASVPLLFAHLSASGIVVAPTEVQPMAEAVAFDQLLPLTLQLIHQGATGVARLTGAEPLA